MSEEGQEGCERTEASSEQDEEGKFFLGVNRHVMKGRQQFSVSVFCTRRVGVKQVAPL